MENMSNSEIRRKGMEALIEKLGYAGMLQFMLQYDSGSGDYTKERHIIHKGETVDSIVKRIKASRKS